jgi:probable O-glycosylation ligase (exosortase A-associated)
VRDIVLVLAIIVALGMTLRWPFVGVLLWTWFALQSPHQETFGFAHTPPLNFIIAVVTIGSWILSRERKIPANGFIFWMMVVFLAWMTFNSFFAFDPAWSWPYWDRTWKTLALGLLVAATATNRVRIHALIWIVVISLFYYGVKGGLFTLITGGHYHVFGPPSTPIGDNNALAVALLMTLPFANYLRTHSADKRIAVALLAGIILTAIAIIGTYSRGAFIGICALGLFGLLRMRNRLAYLGIAAVLVVFVIAFMPAKYWGRMNTINTAVATTTESSITPSPTDDASFHERLVSWQVNFLYARDHFPFGAGFYGPQLSPIFNHYFPDETNHAAHSIYFQVLGEHGFIGLAFYLAILAAAFLKCSKMIAVSRPQPDRRWITDLAIAIQASLSVFCVAGAALSMAYYDLFIIDVTLLLPLGDLALPAKIRPPAWAPKPTAA